MPSLRHPNRFLKRLPPPPDRKLEMCCDLVHLMGYELRLEAGRGHFVFFFFPNCFHQKKSTEVDNLLLKSEMFLSYSNLCSNCGFTPYYCLPWESC